MSRELDRFYRSLADDTDPRGLVPPERVRRYADHRARTRAAVGVVAAAVLVAGTAVGSQFVFAAAPGTPVGPPADTPPAPSGGPTTGTPNSVAPSPSASVSRPSATPSTVGSAPRTSGATTGSPTGGAARPTSIPDRAFFALAAANATDNPPVFAEGEVLPDLCGARPGESGVVARRSRTLAFFVRKITPSGQVPDGNYRHTITIYRAGRAADALTELRQAVRDCPEQPVPGGAGRTSTQRLLPDTGYGDESALVQLSRPATNEAGDPVGGAETRLVRVIRIGDVLTVLWEQGWEGGSSPRTRVDADSRRDEAAVRAWWG